MTQMATPAPAGLAPLFTPKLVTVLREGYGLAQLRADAMAGLTVAIVALPLSMAIAIASGAILGGLLVDGFGAPGAIAYSAVAVLIGAVVMLTLARSNQPQAA